MNKILPSQPTFLIASFIISLLSSCSIEKRVHLPGYHVEWKTGNHNPARIIAPVPQTGRMAEVGQLSTIEQKKHNATHSGFDTKNSSNDNEELLATTETTLFSPPPTLSSQPLNIGTIKEDVLKKVYQGKTKSELRGLRKNIKASLKSNNTSDGGNAALRTIGWVVLIIGLLFLLFISILLGALLMILGLVFVLAGGSKEGSASQSNGKSEYIDVVYLKNGSIIKGMIIEQTPNVSIKIQTRDGSIFVYQMEEVEKMTKELSK